MNGSGVLMLAVGLVAGLMLGQSMARAAAPAVPIQPAKPSSNFFDVIIAGMPIARDIFD
jgi:hypothetical protein